VTSSSETLGDLFATFQREAFRLETLDVYNIPRSAANLQAFLDGKPQPEGYNAEWVEQIRSHTSVGKRVYRVHILSRPLTPYLKYELGWGYRTNISGGEEFFILDTTDRPNPLPGVGDFWFFDSERPAVMHYDESGAFLGAETLPDDRAEEFIRYRETALAHARPFPEWWAEHGE
jgi:hypothetical protein